MTEYRYILEKGSKKHICQCCKKRTFVRYIDTETSEYLPELYGRCDRESKCSTHMNPYLGGYAKALEEQEQGSQSEAQKSWRVNREKTLQPTKKTAPVYFDLETYKHTLNPNRYDKNIFIQNLLKNVPFPFETKAIEKVIALYYLGTISKGYRKGAVTFPFIDKHANIRAVQVKQFDKANHTTGTDFLHSIIEKDLIRKNKPLPEWLESYLKQDKRVSCLFGEHLLSKYPTNPIALVEAPKTAIYGALYFGFPEQPENLIWLAVYNKSSFSIDKLKVLEGREIITFPDLSLEGKTFKEWKSKATEFERQLTRTHFKFSTLLEQLAPDTDKKKGNDLADYLIKHDWRLFQPKREIKKEAQNTEFEPIFNENERIRTTALRSGIEELAASVSIQQSEIDQLEKLCETLESTFIQAAKRCSPKWYGNRITEEPQGKNRLLQLIYLCS